MTKPDSTHVSRGKTIQHPKNRILAALPADEFQRLSPHLTDTTLTFKLSLSKPGQPITHVCFPDSGVCSVMSVTQSGAAAEVGTVGNEGVTGLALFFNEVSEPTESLIQVPGAGRMMSARIFRRELAENEQFHRFIGHYAHALMVQVMQSAACNALHSMEQRACKWMLMTHDRVFTDTFRLTHEFLAMMLGATRPTVTVVAQQLQQAGLIAYRRGEVTVLNRRRLEEGSCECYQVVRDSFEAFLEKLGS